MARVIQTKTTTRTKANKVKRVVNAKPKSTRTKKA